MWNGHRRLEAVARHLHRVKPLVMARQGTRSRDDTTAKMEHTGEPILGQADLAAAWMVKATFRVHTILNCNVPSASGFGALVVWSNSDPLLGIN